MITDSNTLKLAISKKKVKLALLMLNYGMPFDEKLLQLCHGKEMLPVYLHIKKKLK